jgi:hypothetical protein
VLIPRQLLNQLRSSLRVIWLFAIQIPPDKIYRHTAVALGISCLMGNRIRTKAIRQDTACLDQISKNSSELLLDEPATYSNNNGGTFHEPALNETVIPFGTSCPCRASQDLGPLAANSYG